MPYVIVKSVKDGVYGFRVRKSTRGSDGRFRYFSKHPISLEMAKRQLRALYRSERISIR